MKPNTTPVIPPALRKARKPEEISNAFPPITPRTRPTQTETGGPTLPASAPSPTPAPAVLAPPSSAPAPTPKTLSPSPSTPVNPPKPLPTVKPSIDAAISGPKTRPKPVFTGRPAVAELEGKIAVFEGTFRCEENAFFTTETRLTGDPRRDKQSLINLARKRYPTGRMELKSTRVFTREVSAVTSFAPGTTLSQLFGPAGSPTEATIEVGTVFFDGLRCQIYLRNLRSRNSITFSLRQPNGGNINFSNQIQANRLANELLLVAKEVFGNNVRELVITLKEATA